ncbi:hypothetical protein CAPTEDRAFT_221429 [Capitella teleta]|uniref:Uncharacterized protein n=1 Tax=Capitella teleta TaxID=283909 RepID=R7V1J8_CAPTE|nr:hypothetical protein CAPTEDRAFT_221429 [Capitella teleta]|eukprot:ELU10062.1 hypothetical protein CAPTEDRAFT_221429 [Capitella teleta]
MKSSLSCVGFVWAMLSFFAMGLSCVGFYMPLWLEGSMHNSTPSSLNTFRRCNYLRMGKEGRIEVVMECGRYTAFSDIPSQWWQIATVTVGVGCCLLIPVAFGALFSCCVQTVVSKLSCRLGGGFQCFAALCIAAGCLLFPFGWDNPEILQICGNKADTFKLGRCEISWAYYCTMAGGATAFVCFLLSLCSVRQRGGYQRTSTSA